MAPLFQQIATTIVTPLNDKTHIVNTSAAMPVETPSMSPRLPTAVKSATPAASLPTLVASSTTKSPSRMAKGTPGAGKHLKKPVSTAGSKRPAMPKPVDGVKTTAAVKGKDQAAPSAKQ